MAPGETRSLEIDIGNAGTAELAARTYAADVYTIINGGFGARLRDDPQTDTTRWLSYPTQVLRLAAGAGVRRTFAVAVPTDAAPGEYITSLVLENDQPIRGSGAVGLDQVVRQAVAVVVTVPGPRSPGLAIGRASHKVVAGRSVVSIGVENTGNVRLKPLVTFALVDTTGTEISHSTMRMDTFYAHTQTSVEMQLAELLPPGTYTRAADARGRGGDAGGIRCDHAGRGGAHRIGHGRGRSRWPDRRRPQHRRRRELAPHLGHRHRRRPGARPVQRLADPQAAPTNAGSGRVPIRN